ncbi:hypothetical protein [Leptolyngbya sp. FACHB-261]|uniref:hypothetical protein n=1 Tax=Leptolyngbya sp. FACHB-261 TaxID=2692806 RepID=UPI001681E776|nr:hypothetical protein [Leptolyngbya sp. FACHB-261]MBD2104616.1 hypothetical protein [Leptolyngbya sp. FACHB-261]
MRFSFEGLTNRDFKTSLSTWVSLEFLVFVVLPVLKIIPSDNLQRWFLLSLPLGLGGAFLVGVASDFVARAREDEFEGSRIVLVWIGQVGGWFGLAGIGFPMILAVSRFLRAFGNL